jgi:hypothetical protein
MPTTYWCTYGVRMPGSKNSGCSLRRFGGVRLMAGGVSSAGTPLAIDTVVAVCGFGTRAFFRNSCRRST